ncbi:MAG: type II secretion system protein GspD [Betaproteobacteria bacterium]|nr:MAG: type II secretion system protein GspD [Betaproteobacteria bacterium]
MADAHDSAPPLVHRIIAAVRSGVRTRSKPLVAAVVAAFLAAMPAASAQESDTVTLNFVNADIDAVVKAVAEITGRNFVLDPRVKGTINIVSARPVPKSLVYPTLLSALRLQGFTAVESDGIVKIVPEADAKMQGGSVGTTGATGDRLITQVIPLRSESAAQLVNVLRPLISPNNTIAAFPASNALVITDYADNVRRLMRIIASLDQPLLGEPLIVPVKNASALDMVGVLNRTLADSGGQPGAADVRERVSLVAEPRSNSILVRSENPARTIRMRQLIEQLDTPQRAGGNIFIVYLKNADALRVAETLRGLYGGATGAERGLPAVTTATTAPAAIAATAATISAATAASPAATTPLATATTTSAPIVAGNATIQADTANNALIIMAPEPIYNNLRAIIEKLDTRRAQVFIEALIVEVTADKAGEFGIQWQVLTHGYVFGGTNLTARNNTGRNILDASANLANIGQGLNVGVINGTIRLPGTLGEILNLAFLARALATDTNVNILSTPTLLTLDNEEARIMVGSNVPFITGQYATTGSTSTVQPFQTIERRDVGLLLRVKPQITEGGTVRMVLYQEVSRVDPGTITNASGPTLTKRSLESSVAIDDKQIVVLGGLIQDQLIDTADKVPYAGDVPVLGQFFRYDTRARTKTNLLVFLKPTVIRTAADGKSLTSERYDYLRGEQADIQPQQRWFWPDTTFPELTPLPAMQGVAVPPPPGPGVAPRPPPPAK